jgi:hypothetical protein
MTGRPDRSWAGTLAAGGTQVKAAAVVDAGPLSVIVTLATR